MGTSAKTLGARELIVGLATSGAKFTPKNHKDRGDRALDAINRGDYIAITPEDQAAEIAYAYERGVRYLHWHARSPETGEQTSDMSAYRRYEEIAAQAAPDAILSWGGSRNGPEIAEAIKAKGEWSRIAQAALPRGAGGADMVTAFAAIELQIVKDMEAQGYVRFDDDAWTTEILRDPADYRPSVVAEEIDLDVNSTSGGANYGKSSADVQMRVLQRVIAARRALGLPFEGELTQEKRSLFLAWYLANARVDGLRTIGRLNLTVLFGFSRPLPFPEDYAAFRRVIAATKAVAAPRPGAVGTLAQPLDVTVTVGAAVIPQHAAAHRKAIDVGPRAGVVAGPMERLVAWACQPDSGVDVLRVGMEDTPYTLDPAGRILPATNASLLDTALQEMRANGAAPMTDRKRLERFAVRR